MNIIKIITNRLGGVVLGNLLHTIRFIPTKNNFLFKDALNIFLFGKYGKYRDNALNLDIRNAYYNKEKQLDFGIFKLETGYQYVLFEELYALVFPYIIPNFPIAMTCEGVYEKFGVFVEENDYVIDAGANVGLFSYYAASKNAKVFSFEPLPEAYSILQETISLNNFNDKITVFNCALSDTKGIVKFLVNDSITAGTFVDNSAHKIDEKDNYIEVNTITIDEFVETNNIEKIDFIKADIEGSERLMLEGAKKTLEKFKPKLAICIYHLPDDKEVLTKIILDANPSYVINYTNYKLFAK